MPAGKREKERDNLTMLKLVVADVGGDWGSIVAFSPSVFMDWMGWVSWTQRWSYSERVPRDRHVRNGDMAFKGTMRGGVAVERKRMFDLIIAEIAG